MHEMQTIVTDVHSVCLSIMQGHSLQPLPNYFGLLLDLFLRPSFHWCTILQNVL